MAGIFPAEAFNYCLISGMFSIIIQMFSAIGYKHYLIGFLFYLAGYVSSYIVIMIRYDENWQNMELWVPVPAAILGGYLLIAAGRAISWLLSSFLYRHNFSEWATKVMWHRLEK